MEVLDLHLGHWPAASANAPNRYMLWCGNFNRHHPLWDEEQNHHLFTAAALWAADWLLEKVLAHGVLMILPKGTPTLEAKVTKNWTRPDNVFCSVNAVELVVCDTDLCLRGPGVGRGQITSQS